MTLPEARFGHCMVLLNNGTVLITGGTGEIGPVSVATKTCWLFQPKTGTFSECKNMSRTRTLHSCSLFKGKVYIIGGEGDSSEIFDPELNSWNNDGLRFPNNRQGKKGSLMVFQDDLYFREDGLGIFKLKDSQTWSTGEYITEGAKNKAFPLTTLVFSKYSTDHACDIS